MSLDPADKVSAPQRGPLAGLAGVAQLHLHQYGLGGTGQHPINRLGRWIFLRQQTGRIGCGFLLLAGPGLPRPAREFKALHIGGSPALFPTRNLLRTRLASLIADLEIGQRLMGQRDGQLLFNLIGTAVAELEEVRPVGLIRDVDQFASADTIISAARA